MAAVVAADGNCWRRLLLAAAVAGGGNYECSLVFGGIKILKPRPLWSGLFAARLFFLAWNARKNAAFELIWKMFEISVRDLQGIQGT